jgi:hypothetical protein
MHLKKVQNYPTQKLKVLEAMVRVWIGYNVAKYNKIGHEWLVKKLPVRVRFCGGVLRKREEAHQTTPLYTSIELETKLSSNSMADLADLIHIWELFLSVLVRYTSK